MLKKWKLPLLLLVVGLAWCGLATAKNKKKKPEAPVVLEGTILGHNGKPIAVAHAQLFRRFVRGAVKTVRANEKGAFRIEINAKGLYELNLMGIFHKRRSFVLWLKPGMKASFKVQLTTPKYAKTFKDIRIIGNFNKFSRKNAPKMKKRKDGSYVFSYKTKKKTFEYNLLGLFKNRRWIAHGTQASSYKLKKSKVYRSVVFPVDGKVEIVFQPDTLLRSKTKSKVLFATKGVLRINQLLNELTKQRIAWSKAYRKHIKAGKTYKTFHFPWRTFHTKIKNQLSKEKDPLFKQALLLAEVSAIGLGKNYRLRMARTKRLPKLIPADSPVWSISYGAIRGVAYHAKPSYLRKLEKHPNQSIRFYLYVSMFYRHFWRDKSKARLVYLRMKKQFASSKNRRFKKRLEYFKRMLSQKLKVGARVPFFAVSALDKKKTVYTHRSFPGKYRLLVFWATWCGPCKRKLPALHEAYQRYHGKNLEILSLSFDRKPKKVHEYRKRHWVMPWRHGFAKGSFHSRLAKSFEVFGIPAMFLVNPKGRIIAKGSKLRVHFFRILAEHLDEPTLQEMRVTKKSQPRWWKKIFVRTLHKM